MKRLSSPGAVDAAQANAPMKPDIRSTVAAEVVAGFREWPVWLILGWDDVRQRYRRSILGPFWITLSLGAFVLLMGTIYSRLLHTEAKSYMPFLAAGYIFWGFISQTTLESCMAFHDGSRIIKQIKLPYSIYVLRVFCRNFIVLLHTIVVFIPVALIFKVVPNWATFYLLPGLFLVCINQIWVGMILGILNTRFRDTQPIVTTAVPIMLFATPIMWQASSLDSVKFIAEINPLYHLIEVVRAPMLGNAPELQSWLVTGGMAIVGSALAIALLVRTSRQIVFWV
jgi:ABC-2 type transport system permease protein